MNVLLHRAACQPARAHQRKGQCSSIQNWAICTRTQLSSCSRSGAPSRRSGCTD